MLNTQADEAGLGVIRHGNERVLRARFNDARFFWEFDQRVPLVERVELLEKVTFQKDLGSYAAKTERVREVCLELAETVMPRGCAVDAVALDEAARLAKTDLTTELVKEFTELQGVVGGLYARAQGFGAEDGGCDLRPVPAGVDGGCGSADGGGVAAGDCGQGGHGGGDVRAGAGADGVEGSVCAATSGERDCEDSGGERVALPLTLGEVAAAASGDERVVGRVTGFFAERLEFYLREARGQAYDVVKAVLAAGADDVRDAVARAEAVTAVRGAGATEILRRCVRRSSG